MASSGFRRPTIAGRGLLCGVALEIQIPMVLRPGREEGLLLAFGSVVLTAVGSLMLRDRGPMAYNAGDCSWSISRPDVDGFGVMVVGPIGRSA